MCDASAYRPCTKLAYPAVGGYLRYYAPEGNVGSIDDITTDEDMPSLIRIPLPPSLAKASELAREARKVYEAELAVEERLQATIAPAKWEVRYHRSSRYTGQAVRLIGKVPGVTGVWTVVTPKPRTHSTKRSFQL